MNPVDALMCDGNNVTFVVCILCRTLVHDSCYYSTPTTGVYVTRWLGGRMNRNDDEKRPERVITCQFWWWNTSCQCNTNTKSL